MHATPCNVSTASAPEDDVGASALEPNKSCANGVKEVRRPSPDVDCSKVCRSNITCDLRRMVNSLCNVRRINANDYTLLCLCVVRTGMVYPVRTALHAPSRGDWRARKSLSFRRVITWHSFWSSKIHHFSSNTKLVVICTRSSSTKSCSVLV